MLNNVELFNECLEHPAKNVDSVARETLNKVILPLDDSIPTELLVKNHRLLELIILYNSYKSAGDRTHNTEILSEMDECLRYEGMNYCPFSQYFMVHDVTYDMYLNKLTNDEKEYIIDCYLEDRHQMYLNRDYSDIIFQVLTDNYSHKRKGAMGVEKLKKICRELQIPKIDTENQIEGSLYYILPDAGDNQLFNKIIEKNHINFEFRNTHQGKMPDALIKVDNTFLVVEHKILKESGGGQDKQMTEIIDFVGWGERGVHYVSFMDGILFNELVNPSPKNKMYRDKQNIILNLENCPFNYFVNEYGFGKLISHILETRD